MELAVLLAAGLRDWIDFGVIVRMLKFFQYSYPPDILPLPDRHLGTERFRRMVSRKAGRRHCRAA